MRNEDNDCIRYLMKEMDPSEELLMERAMMEDEDLLIEVESMRQTLQKLDQLPEVEPPPKVTESILEKAADHAKDRKTTPFKPAFKYAVAATLALTITAGGTWFFIGTENSKDQQSQQGSVTSTAAPQKQITESSAGSVLSSDNMQQISTSTTTKNSEVDPWIDRNDVLRVEDQFSSQGEQFKAILERSMQKLQLIENPSVNGGRVNPIQLTGSGN